MNHDLVICGDVALELPKLASGTVQMVVADPPYFNVMREHAWDTQWPDTEAYLIWCRQWVAECMRVLREDGLCFIFGQPGKREHGFIHLMSALCREHRFHDLLIWDRVVGYNDRSDSFTPAYEMALVLRKGDTVKFNKGAVREQYSKETIQEYLRDNRYKDREARLKHLEAGKYSTNLIRVPSLKGNSKEKCGHPTQKPLDLITKLVACASDPGDLVLDPFVGSGTTAVVAKTLGRSWVGIELNPHYAEAATKRVAATQAAATQEVLATTGAAPKTRRPKIPKDAREFLPGLE
ncbi:MAG: site-specific DNA-methyltransferase [Verrucomicrobia bacterium]|nr:MAG: site-specific DNA-methyltransferase [Verrucomicrobiota bacterium]